MAGLNQTPDGERLHIGFFGCRNAGKSSLLNAFTGQNLAIVSNVKGTTTDPVYKTMELLPLGPVVIIDTPGIDDEGELGSLRVAKAKQALNKCDLAIIVVDASTSLSDVETSLINGAKERNIPYIIAHNKADLLNDFPQSNDNEIWVSAKTGANVNSLKEKCGELALSEINNKRLVADIINTGDFVVLVVPIDKAAPKGRLILPQQQTIRDILDGGATAIVCRDSELKQTIDKLGNNVKLVVTDSQVFASVKNVISENLPLTSFSILMARYKGDLPLMVKGAKAVDDLKSGDTVLISEGCTHHRQCEDIGTVKLPAWITKRVGEVVKFEFTSGTEFPENLNKYKMIVHCGGCMLNQREMRYRLRCAQNANVPVTNYGTLIAYLNGILSRTIQPFPELRDLL